MLSLLALRAAARRAPRIPGLAGWAGSPRHATGGGAGGGEARATPRACSAAAAVYPWALWGNDAAGIAGGGCSLYTCRLASSDAAAQTKALIRDLPPGEVGPMNVYRAGVKKKTYRPDPQQEGAIALLEQLHVELLAHPPRQADPGGSGLALMDALDDAPPASGGFFSWMGSSSSSSSSSAEENGGVGDDIKGVYMFGGVGTGKTMLMDLFVDTCPREWQVKRVHFHDFMLDVHSRLRRKSSRSDPLLSVADELARGTSIICLDELFVTDVADATILNRLFGRLWEKGVLLVSTSNRAPTELYKGGLQRHLFLPFIAALQERCVVYDIGAETDYRQSGQHQTGVYFSGPDAKPQLKRVLREVTGGAVSHPSSVEVMMGRTLPVPNSYGRTVACYFRFRELCEQPLAAADYIALATKYHTVALSGVPLFKAANRSAAYRFVTLVDVLYEHKVKILTSAEVAVDDLFDAIISNDESRKLGGVGIVTLSDGVTTVEVCVDDNLSFAKDRTLSRLTEMQSEEYLAAHTAAHSNI